MYIYNDKSKLMQQRQYRLVQPHLLNLAKGGQAYLSFSRRTTISLTHDVEGLDPSMKKHQNEMLDYMRI